MAKQLFSNAYCMLNTVDLSLYIRSLTLNTSTDIVDVTTMNPTAITKEKVVGFDDWSVDVEWAQDFVAAKVDATVWAVRVLHAAVAIIMKPNGSTTAVTNPKFTGNVILASYSPLAGSVGDAAMVPTHFEGSGTLTRATSD
jgi:predicted secreted protein